MTLEALRMRIEAADFTRLLRQWAGEHRYGNATIEQFQARAEQISGKRLGHFFDAWLRTPGKPADW
jgi:aminopeptidase N